MPSDHEEYVPPVGFASEPTAERRRWIGRIVLVLFIMGLIWMLWFKVINPEDNSEGPQIGSTQDPLPAPR